MFVGDSLGSNQWQSLTCMLHTAVPQAPYNLWRKGAVSTFAIPAHNISVMFLRNALLVDVVDEGYERVLKLDSINGAKQWEGIDVLIFDSWHWWLHSGRKQPWDVMQVGNKTKNGLSRYEAYKNALKTWAGWVDTKVDTNKTKIFFQGVSPDHLKGTEWGKPDGSHCGGEEGPLLRATYPGGRHPAEGIVDKVLQTMSKPVSLLRITTLSQLRVDGHPSIYGNPRHIGMDCSHWCLAGVPDTWNVLLYASLIQR
ncbi:hypothetical protein RJ639_028502 [Escallonia herrerae]|uniref:Trichome birefringence-like C-terminal domain-containing protein n=1 Tax=Escallonia herrerae TaxID=1293975 RepID=A0AA88X383_9ASTE|nr:hypothetical protein RJ639_028502 [Escallonia herrerae]